jgi:26S proteasome regulatory subunit N1
MDLLLKLAHDPDQELSYRAVLSLGILGAGTNNSRIADIFRGLAVFNAKDPNGLFLVRIAQGLLHMGKVSCFRLLFL